MKKRLLSLVTAIAMMCSFGMFFSEGVLTVSAHSYSSDYSYWSQGASDDSGIRSWGCWVVAQSEMIYEANIDRSSSFNPDTYYLWEKNNGYIDGGYYQTDGGNSPVAYANQKGKNLEYLGYWDASDNQLWFNINAGYYTILHVSGGYASGDHYVLIDNALSKQTGRLYCYDSYPSKTSIRNNLITVYTNHHGGYVYKANNPIHVHDYTSSVTKQPTCTETGIKTFTCKAGDSTYTESIPKLGHNYSTRIVQPTITEKGYNLHTCTRCGDSYKDNYVDAPSLKDDGWYYCSKLPSGVTASDYEIQYKNNYEKIQENSPGADWKNAGTAQDEWVNTGNAYRSLTELSTSDSRVLTGWNYFHFCGSNAGVYANYEQSGNYVHCDEIDPGRVWVASEGWDSEGNIPYYILNWNGGSDRVYCESGTTCDGSYGTHGQRAYTWYKQFWYQDRTHIVKYKFTKTSGWTSSADSSANSTEIRFRNKHAHNYISKVTKAATCATEGIRTYTCSCGDSYTETIPKLTTHTFGNWSVTTNASCKAEGTETRKCSVCGKAETRAIAKTAHSYTSTVIAPTTSAQGYTLHTCSVCGASYKDNYTDKVHTHNYTSQVTRTATCAATGVRTYTCSCGDSYTETIPKTAHKYTEKVIAPTTTAQGYTLHTCSICGNSYKDNYTDKLAVHTHSYTSKVTKSATCAATGVRTYTCSCGDSYTETIPKTAHKYTEKVIAPTTTAQGYTLHTCSICGNSYKDNYTDKLAVHTHSYTSKVTKSATCAATGVRTYTCSCGDSYTEIIPMAEHNYTAKTVAPTYTAQGYTLHTCSVCGDSYKDTYTAKLTPKTESISKATVTGISAKTYTGKAITQSPVVKLGTTTLKNGTDYTVAYKNNTKVGTATVTITGKGSYTGTISKTFKINTASIAKATVSGLSNKTYTGKAITQNPTVKLGSKTLKKGTDYTVTFKNNKAVGKATVTIKGKGNYTGSISKTFKINPKKTTLKTATSPKTKQLKVTYSKVSGVTGYQTVYSTSSKFTKATTKTASSKSTSKTISGLTKGKTYYVKVRTYKTVKGTKYYSGYSAVKKIKIK